MDKSTAHRGVGKRRTIALSALLAAFALHGQSPAAPAQNPSAKSRSGPTSQTAQADSTAGKLAAASADATAVLPAWDVSTIKPSTPDERGSMVMFTPDGIRIQNVPLITIAREAFGFEEDRIYGGPGWAKTSMFDIEAKVAPEDAPKLKVLPIEQRRAMLVALLEERCGLKFHHETRDLPEYELVVAKSGMKMQASKPDDPNGDNKGKHMLMMHGHGHLESTGTGMSGLARILSAELRETVVDKTGLPGNYDFKLDWTPDEGAQAMVKAAYPSADASAPTQDNGGPSIFSALEEQLGLKLEATKGPVEVVVVDQLEQPTAN